MCAAIRAAAYVWDQQRSDCVLPDTFKFQLEITEASRVCLDGAARHRVLHLLCALALLVGRGGSARIADGPEAIAETTRPPQCQRRLLMGRRSYCREPAGDDHIQAMV
jgi:hypothetical protein